jgi:hypothetical protein
MGCNGVAEMQGQSGHLRANILLSLIISLVMA